ncbi:cytochrome P450 [Lipomyces starkeyi]|uniref:Cytochrome P450 n=1 Tax=Lipomyces starkeyi NRRL Y-11557 TaxID=675824 RepID=A0A1E3PUI1_LIPST|nr:hypothetical protein LIPSTDRAFT_202542 [Lipomyces starkeyi NRRL Y-11557]
MRNRCRPSLRPEGVNVGTGIFSIQHNERYFHNPFEFTPERWLADGKLSQAHEPDAYVPFSIGPRVCLGKGLAISEVSLAMAHICWTMDFAVVESMKDIGGGNKDDVYGTHRPGEFQLYDHITCTRWAHGSVQRKDLSLLRRSVG